jgi:hypothetical protein
MTASMTAEKQADEQQQKQIALQYLLDAWQDAVIDGIDSDMLATVAIFTALSDMVVSYGEEEVARMIEGLPARIRLGEFTVNRMTQ